MDAYIKRGWLVNATEAAESLVGIIHHFFYVCLCISALIGREDLCLRLEHRTILEYQYHSLLNIFNFHKICDLFLVFI